VKLSARGLLYLLVAFVLVLMLFPFYWILVTSLKTPGEIFSFPPSLFPGGFNWSNYLSVFTRQPFHIYLKNSFIVAGLTTLVCLMLGSLAAYALARLRFKGKGLILSIVLAVSMFPPIAIVSPLFLMLKSFHLLNTYPALIFPYTTFAMPLTIWILTSFFKQLPAELEEAARVDGCTPMVTFSRILLPLAAPGVFTCAILVFISAWNEFLFALTFTTSNLMRTVPVGITMYPGEFEMPWGTIFAAAALVTIPLIALVLLFQRRIVSGLTAGAVKG
jgi:multiple sugar transport system permease protein